MSYIRIVNRQASGVQPEPGELVVPVDLQGRSVLFNRHARGQLGPTREQAIERNAADLEADLARQGPMSQELERLARLLEDGQPLALQCYCAPKACHAETYRKHLEARLGRSLLPPERDNGCAPADVEQG